MFDMVATGFSIVLEPATFLIIFLGIIAGTIFGSMPGVSASMAIALCVPFTYVMRPVVSIAFLVAVYCSSITGGGITAILFKIPGTPSSAPTTFDGYPLAVQGRAGEALGTVKDVMETGANDVYIVEMKDGRELLLPAIGDCILDVNLDEGRMTVHVLDGLMDL